MNKTRTTADGHVVIENTDRGRRRFLGGSAALATGIALSPWLSGTASAQGKRGGHFRMGKGHGQTTDSLNPGTWENGFMIALGQAIHGYMTEVGPEGNIRPLVAESWESNEDATRWSFRVRPGMTFHSGKAVTVEDVIASIEHHGGEDSQSAAAPQVAEIVAMRADGDDTVVFDLAGGNADFPFLLSDYHLAIVPIKDGVLDWQSGDGCGSYKLENFDAGVKAVCSRNDNYWASDRAFFDSFEMLVLIDPNARMVALQSGEVDSIDRIDLKTVNLLKRNTNIDIHSIAGNQHYTFAMSCNQDPFTDNHVRLALKHAIDRQELVDKILFGYGVIGNDHPIGQGQRFFNTDLAQTPYDPDKARWHLEQAGMDSLKVSLSAADAAYLGAVDAAVLYQNSAQAANITIDVVREPGDGYWSNVWMKKPFSAVYWGGRPVEDSMLTLAYQSGASWNDTFWSNERFDELLLAARAEIDEARRRDMYFEMQAILNQNGGAIIPMFASYVFATTKAVGTPDTMATNWDQDGERWFERWWFV